MNYRRIYDTLIKRAQARDLTGYCEVHHIIPRCMGGTNDTSNLVKLTPEEHYVAHQLLAKIYPHEPKLIFALVRMSGKYYEYKNNKLYGWIRRKFVVEMSKPKSDSHKRKIGNANRGRKQTPEHIRKRIESTAKTVIGKQPRKTKGREPKKRIKDMTLDELYAYWAAQENKRKKKKEMVEITALLYSLT